jgi:RNA polymerase sigma-70 factor (ECF subfamily)
MANVIGDFSLALPAQHTASSSPDLAQDIASLVETYSPLLFRIAHSVLRNRAEAEDTVQDTFVRVLQQQHKGNPLHTIRDMRVWLVRIAWNLALDRRRNIRPEQMDDIFVATLTSPNLPADQALDETRRIQSVLRELDRLPKKERQVLLLSGLEELSIAELANITGRTESAVRALLFRARTRLRNRLDQGANQ